MNISILTVGTRGDVQPCVALAIELQNNGVDVSISTHKEYQDLIENNGIKFFELPGNPAEQWDNNEKESERKRESFIKQLETYARGWLKASLEICKNADAIIYTPLFFIGNHLAEKLNIRYFPIVFEPNIKTEEFPSAYLQSDKDHSKFFNKLTHSFSYQTFWQRTRGCVNRLRKDVLNLPKAPIRGYLTKMQNENIPFLCSFSNYIVTKPFDWNRNVIISGYWFLKNSNQFQPNEKVVEFLDSGKPPLFFDFGSFAHDRMKNKLKIIFKDIVKSGERLILDPGKTDLSIFDLPRETFIIKNPVPHEWLLPKVSAIVSHGGVGVTHAAVKAKIPTIPIAIFGAQYFWGKKLFELNLAAKPMKIHKLKENDVFSAIEYLKNKNNIKKLNRIGNLVNDENGVSVASKFIINYLNKKLLNKR